MRLRQSVLPTDSPILEAYIEARKRPSHIIWIPEVAIGQHAPNQRVINTIARLREYQTGDMGHLHAHVIRDCGESALPRLNLEGTL